MASGGNMPFTFVDAAASDGRDNRHKIRKHLGIFHALQRRQRESQKQRHIAELRSKSVVAAGPLAWRYKKENEGEEGLTIAKKAHETEWARSSSKPLREARTLRLQDYAHVNSVLLDCTSGSPTSFMSAARTDPFHAYPIVADPEIDASVDFFVHDLGPYLYGYARNDSFDLLRQRAFVIASQDPAAFHTNMLLASINLDLLSGNTLPGMRALRHRVEAVRLINERLAVSTKHLGESTIYTIIVLTTLEHIWGAIGRKEVYSEGLDQVLIKCGGLKALRKFPLLEHVLYSICVVNSQLISLSDPDLFSEDQSHSSQQDECRSMANELVQLLYSTIAREYSWPLSMLAFAFQPGSPLHETLMSPAFYLSKPNVPHSSEAAERSRLSILLHFHSILMRLPEHVDIVKLVRKLTNLNRDAWIWQKSVVMAQYMIVKAEDSAAIEDANLAWHVLRLVEVCALLSDETYSNVKHYLFSVLSQSGSYPSLDLQKIQRELDSGAQSRPASRR